MRRKHRRCESKPKFPNDATWVDLEEPTAEEEALVERCIHLDVPTETEMAEIEPSSRLFERNGALYMTVSVLIGVEDGQPTTTPISFVLTDNRLVTVRYATPKARSRLLRACTARSGSRARCAHCARANA